MTAEIGAVRSVGWDVKVLALVGSGHFLSHFYAIVLPPLFPLLATDLGTSYAALGLLLSVANLATSALQLPVGVLVDRFGARLVLAVGLGLVSAAVAGMGLATGYGLLLGLALVFGLGNSVFHPADYAILSNRIAPQRIGRAFSMHTLSGHLGRAVSPAIIAFLAVLWNWRVALVLVGLCGLLVMVAILVQGRTLDEPGEESVDDDPRAACAEGEAKAAESEGASPGSLRFLFSAPMLLFFVYMALSSVASNGLSGFTVTALVDAHGTPLAVANAGLTALLGASVLGVFLGGQVADATRRHDLVVCGGFFAAAIVLVLIALVSLPMLAMIVALGLVGLASGAIRPSRDMMVRAISPKKQIGKAFGFVTTGMNIGGALAPVFFGWLIDQGHAPWIFLLAALAMVLALVAALLGSRSARPVPDARPAE